MEKLRQRWGLTSNWGILGIIIAFAINGTFSARIVKPLLSMIGISKEHLKNEILYWVIYITIMFLVYQFTLPYSGWLMGQYKFFKNFQQKMLSRFKLNR